MMNIRQDDATRKSGVPAEFRLITLIDLEILARMNDRIRDACGGPCASYWCASDGWLDNLNL